MVNSVLAILTIFLIDFLGLIGEGEGEGEGEGVFVVFAPLIKIIR